MDIGAIQTLIQYRRDHLWRPIDAIPPSVVGALTLVALTAAIVTISIFAAKNHWMPVENKKTEAVDGKEVTTTTTDYTAGAVLFGLLGGIIGGPLISLFAAGLTAGVMAVPKQIKDARLENLQNSVTHENAWKIFLQQVGHLPPIQLMLHVNSLSFGQLAEVKVRIRDKSFKELMELSDLGERRCAWQLLRDYQLAQDKNAFIREHTQQLRDYAEWFDGFSAQAEMVGIHIPQDMDGVDVAALDDNQLKDLIEKELDCPDPTLLTELESAVKRRLSSENAKEWISFFEGVTRPPNITIDDYDKKWAYIDTLILCAKACLPLPELSRDQTPPEYTETSENRPKFCTLSGLQFRFALLSRHSPVFKNLEDIMTLQDKITPIDEENIDFSFESEEIKKGLAYIIEHILNQQPTKYNFDELCDNADNRELLRCVILTCEKYQFHETNAESFLGKIEYNLATKSNNSSNDRTRCDIFSLMPNSKILGKIAYGRLVNMSQSQRIDYLVNLAQEIGNNSDEVDLEHKINELNLLSQIIIDGYKCDDAITHIEKLDKAIIQIGSCAFDVENLSSPEERLQAFRGSVLSALRDVRTGLCRKIVYDLETKALEDTMISWFTKVWNYAEKTADIRLIDGCFEALAVSNKTEVHKALVIEFGGRIPTALYGGWRKPRYQLLEKVTRHAQAGNLKTEENAEWFKKVWSDAAENADDELKRTLIKALESSDISFYDELFKLWKRMVPPPLKERLERAGANILKDKDAAWFKKFWDHQKATAEDKALCVKALQGATDLGFLAALLHQWTPQPPEELKPVWNERVLELLKDSELEEENAATFVTISDYANTQDETQIKTACEELVTEIPEHYAFKQAVSLVREQARSAQRSDSVD